MSWLTQNGIWILLGVGVLLLLGRARHHGRGGMGHHRYEGYPEGENSGTPPTPPDGVYSDAPLRSGVAIDPVTRQDVSVQAALTSIYQGRIYYFGSAESRQRFEASPAQYAREELGRSLAPANSSESPPRHRRRGC